MHSRRPFTTTGKPHHSKTEETLYGMAKMSHIFFSIVRSAIQCTRSSFHHVVRDMNVGLAVREGLLPSVLP